MPPHRPVLDSVYGSVHDDFAPLLVRQSGAYTVDEVTPRFPKAARVAVVALVALTGVMAVVASAPAASVAMVHAGIRMQAWARATGADGDYSLDGTTYEVTRNGYASQTHTFTC